MKKNKKIIITGTSRGIGLELARKFAEQEYQVLALSRNNAPVSKINSEYISSFSFDISNDSDFEKVTEFVKDSWEGQVDILINNAGAILNKPFKETTSEDFRKVYEVNVIGVARLTQAVLPFMKGGAHVLAISSMGGIQGSVKFPGLAAYSSSKAAIITLNELLAEEYKDQGIAFNTLALGAVQTEMLEEAFPGYKAPLSADEMADYILDFSLTGNKYYNGKVLQVSASTP